MLATMQNRHDVEIQEMSIEKKEELPWKNKYLFAILAFAKYALYHI